MSMSTQEYLNRLKSSKPSEAVKHVCKALDGAEFVVRELAVRDLEDMGIDSIRMDVYATNREVCEQIAIKSILEPSFMDCESFGVDSPIDALRLNEQVFGPVNYHVFLTEILGIALRFRKSGETVHTGV